MEMIDTDITNHVQNAILECQMQGMPMNDIKLIDVQPFKRPEIGPDVIDHRANGEVGCAYAIPMRHLCLGLYG
jgi:hypothetical protein